jgi:O-antigen ligase
MDIAVLIVAAVAGYGLLQKISPVEYPVLSFDGVRIDSTLGYANTAAAVLGMGVVLSLGRMAGMRNAVFRGLYAALVLAFLIALYLTISRGGLASLGVGLLLLLVLAKERLQMVANLLLLCAPGAWLLWRMQDLEGLLLVDASEAQKVAAGTAFRNDLILALAAAFVLQAGYSLLLDRFEPTVRFRRIAAALVLGGAVLVVASGAFVVVDRYGGIGQAYEKLTSNPAQTENVGRRLGSLSIGYRTEYWKVAWEDWKQHPLTGTGAGTFRYTWLQERSDTNDVRQVHNLYLEQGTEIGVFGFLALLGFVALLVGYTARAAWRSSERGGENGPLLAGLVAALVVYLVSSVLEWHWYIPASTLLFFVLAAVAAKLAARGNPAAETSARPADGETPRY